MASRDPTRESERRFGTVVFADIVGFTTTAATMDPEEVAVVVNTCFETLEDAVTSHGGYVDKYMGDCIMAVFGLPNAIEHAPALAVRAAIDMRKRLDTLRRETRVSTPLDLHIGINSGLVLAGQVGGRATSRFTVMGDAVNLASRLKDLAGKGEIFVGPYTYQHTREEFDYAPVGPLDVKGKAMPVHAYKLVSDVARVQRPRHGWSDSTIASRLVGRECELDQLRACIARVHRGEGAILSISGEAGLGKSRLVTEMTEMEEVGGLTVLHAEAWSIGGVRRLHPFVDLFRKWAAIREDDGPERAFTTLERAVGQVAPDDTAELVPFLATLMGLPLSGGYEARLQGIDGKALEELIAKAVRDLLRRIAATGPVIAVFEDLHWADVSSIKLLESVLRLVDDTAILFVHVFRPGHPEPARLLRVVHRHYHHRHTPIDLEPLSPRASTVLARNLLGLEDLPDPILGAIVRQAEGNPFFIEEVLRSLIDAGALEYRHGRFAATPRMESMIVPGSIREVIMSRVDRLPESVRRILQIASVIGRSFHRHILAAVVPDAAQLDWALHHLEKRHLIVERPTRGQRGYMFTHALAQETVYQSVLLRTRKELHLNVAHAVEASFDQHLPQFYGMLAYHFGRAEDFQKAEEYLFKAGDEASRTAASDEALDYFQQASQLFLLLHGERGDPTKRALLEKNIGLALLNKGNLQESIPHFDQALTHLGDVCPRGSIAVGLRFGLDMLAVLRALYLPRRTRRHVPQHVRDIMEIRFNRAKAQTTTDTTRFFIDSIGSIRRLNQTDPAAVEQACGMYAGGAALFSFSGVSFRIGGRFLDVAGSLVGKDNVRDLLVYRSMRFIHEYLQGDWSENLHVDEPLVEQGLRCGLLWDVCVYLGMSCEQSLRRGDFAAARAELKKLRDIADAYGSDFARSNHDGRLAMLLIEERRLDDAITAVEEYYAAQDERLFRLIALGWRAKIALLQGARERAAVALNEADRLIGKLAHVPPFHRSASVVSQLRYDVTALEDAVARGGRRELLALHRRARRSSRAAVKNAALVASERTETYRLVGRLHWLAGNTARALRWWARSIAEGERLGARPELARTQAEVGRRLSSTSNRPLKLNGLDAAAYMDRARRLLTDLELTGDLEELGTGPTRAAGRRANGSR